MEITRVLKWRCLPSRAICSATSCAVPVCVPYKINNGGLLSAIVPNIIVAAYLPFVVVFLRQNINNGRGWFYSKPSLSL
jgi:hypothetical protein